MERKEGGEGEGWAEEMEKNDLRREDESSSNQTPTPQRTDPQILVEVRNQRASINKQSLGI